MPLLHALRISHAVDITPHQKLKPFRNIFLSKSRTCYLYTYLFLQYLKGIMFSRWCLFSRIAQTCESFGISVIKYISDRNYAASQIGNVVKFPPD